jgi:hypothetical protein
MAGLCWDSPLCLACQFFRNFVIRYLAIYGVGIFAAYSIIHYKTPWIIISIVWPLLFVSAAARLRRRFRARPSTWSGWP